MKQKKRMSIYIIVSAGGYGKVAEQVSQLEQLGTLDLDAVLLLAVAYDGFDKVIDRLVAKGVKVIAVGTPVSSPKVSLGVVQSQQQIGEVIAGYACERKPKGELITLPGPAGSEWNKMRFDGIKSGAEKCGMRLVGNTFEGQISIEDGQRQTSDMLIKYPDADYLYAVAGIFGVGAAQQIQREPRKAKGPHKRLYTTDAGSDAQRNNRIDDQRADRLRARLRSIRRQVVERRSTAEAHTRNHAVPDNPGSDGCRNRG